MKSRLDNARKAFSDVDELTPEFCKVQKDFIDILQGRKKTPNKETQDNLKNISDLENKDLVKFIDAVTTACNAKTEESYLNVNRVLFDRDARTCAVSSYTYKQSFRLVLDDVSGARSWVAKGEPSGPCGIVQLSRFEPEKLEKPKINRATCKIIDRQAE